MKLPLLILILLIPVCTLFGQETTLFPKQDSSIIIYTDTSYSIVTDSFSHNFGTITNTPDRLVKYFKYIGNDSISISRAWTGDPHYICEYPKGYLTKGKIYSFTVCFAREYRPGQFNKIMGLTLSNGDRISFTFKGNVVSKE